MKEKILGALAAGVLIALPVTALPAQSGSQDSLSDTQSAFADQSRRADWHTEVAKTERGYRIGNPDAEASLIEFISYTCGHCAHFARQGDPAMELVLLSPGKMTVEVRPVIRNAIDLTVSMLVSCGGEEAFKDRHRMYLLRQDTWLEKARNAPQSQQAIWARGDQAARASMASALDLDDMLADRGVSRADIATCLADDQAALALIRNANADREEFAVPGTPSFALDGALIDGVHSWDALYPVLSERFRPGNGQE